MPEPELNPHVERNNARMEGERAAERRAPKFDRIPPGPPMEGRLSEDLQALSARVSRTIACLRQWYQLNELGFIFEDVPKEAQALVDNLIKSTRKVLQDWNEIPKD